MRVATELLEAIEQQMVSDQGARFRYFEKYTLPAMDDAYSTSTFPFRSHLGASMLGRECARELWYGFRWTLIKKHDSKLLRLFNRGHLEEARFIAMLLAIGATVEQQTPDGKQYRISHAGGHVGGSGDGKGTNIPGLAPGQWCVLEFKTSNRKNFDKLIKDGVQKSKYEHYVQMNMYMRKMAIPIALYMSVCKETDRIHAEWVILDALLADQYLSRGEHLVFLPQPPKRISNSPSNWQCKWCDYIDICHYGEPVHNNCRTCVHSVVHEDGTWRCNKDGLMTIIETKEEQLAGCSDYDGGILER